MRIYLRIPCGVFSVVVVEPLRFRKATGDHALDAFQGVSYQLTLPDLIQPALNVARFEVFQVYALTDNKGFQM